MDDTSAVEKTPPEVTVCVVPRERFSLAVASLKRLIENTDYPAQYVYVDGNSPPPIAAKVAATCEVHGIVYVRTDHYLSPNQARNIALRVSNTPYVAFVDNDLFVSPGWLCHLMDCARSTGAWAVGPLVMEGSESLQVIHMAGGDLVEDKVNGQIRVRQRHRHMYETLSSVQEQLVRESVGAFEFHCVLLRVDKFGERCFLDEGFLALQEHLDHAREIHKRGAEVYFEPRSIVRYDSASPFEDCDREYFELRWGVQWCKESIEHTRQKWGLEPGDPGLIRLEKWSEKHRLMLERSGSYWERRIIPIIVRRKASTWLRKYKIMPPREVY